MLSLTLILVLRYVGAGGLMLELVLVVLMVVLELSPVFCCLFLDCIIKTRIPSLEHETMTRLLFFHEGEKGKGGKPLRRPRVHWHQSSLFSFQSLDEFVV